MFNTEAQLSDNEFNKFRKLIYTIAGISLSDRKRELVKSRLARRLRHYDLASYAEYYDLLCDPQQSKLEIEQFTNALTTNKTEFFREAHHFEYLHNEFFPALRQQTLSGREKRLRIWCAAASTGQEPYTLAMTMLDYFGPQSDWDMRLLASDIDTQVLNTGIEGVYPEGEMEGVSKALRSKHFVRESRGTEPTWRVKPELKQLITFRQLNLNQPPWPINIQFDAIFCRNVMIYFDLPTQTQLVNRFSEYLVPGGLLVIGHSESLFSITDQFDSLGETIYKLKPSAGRVRRQAPISAASSTTSTADAQIDKPGPRTTNHLTRVTNSTSKQQHMTRMPGAVSSHTAPDQQLVVPTKVLVVGEYEASRDECMLQTVLGSCVAACLYDPTNRLGGMNHFMLPESLEGDRNSANYGVHAMELLINAIMKLGGSRRHLIAKVFGGARVVQNLSHSNDVGKCNVEFVKQFLEKERIPLVAEHVLGDCGRRVKLMPTTGKVFVNLLDRTQSLGADKEDREDGRRAWEKTMSHSAATVTMFTS